MRCMRAFKAGLRNLTRGHNIESLCSSSIKYNLAAVDDGPATAQRVHIKNASDDNSID